MEGVVLVGAQLSKCLFSNIVSLPSPQQLLPFCRHYNEWKDKYVLQFSGLYSSQYSSSAQYFTVDLLNRRMDNNSCVMLARYDISGQWISVTCPRPMIFVKLVFHAYDTNDRGKYRVEYLVEESKQWEAVSAEVATGGRAEHEVMLFPKTSSSSWRIYQTAHNNGQHPVFTYLHWYSVFE